MEAINNRIVSTFAEACAAGKIRKETPNRDRKVLNSTGQFNMGVFRAAEFDRDDVIKFLIDEGVDVNLVL